MCLVCELQSLLLLAYLVKNGSERVVSSAREHTYDMRQLESYTFTDEHNRDQGINGWYTILIGNSFGLNPEPNYFLCGAL